MSFFPSLLVFLGMCTSLHAAAQAPTPPAPPADSSTIKIGLIFPLTGGSADMGNSARVGAQVAVNEINEVGGYLGRKLQLVIRDDEANPDVGLRHAGWICEVYS